MVVVMMNTILYANMLAADNKLKSAVAKQLNSIIETGQLKNTNGIEYFILRSVKPTGL